MVYDWEDKQETCYRLYVDEKKSLDDVMKFFREEVGFVPSKRAFQTQFRRWGFPSKQNPAHRNVALVARTRELWEKNTTQKDMAVVLQAEGFNVTERELMRLRSKHRLLLRGANARSDDQPVPQAAVPDSMSSASPSMGPTHDMVNDDHLGKRKERLEELQKDSNVRLESKKRRRRTRGWAGLPADPPGPPRFPSETTLEASKARLGLNNASYLEVRNTFSTICQEQGIVKKTTVGPERWQAAKSQLMQCNEQLGLAFQQADQAQADQMRLSLDVICMDVTKRLRNLEHHMTLAEAKNMLKVNPEEGRRLRQALIDLLAANKFVNKHESDNWDQLKQQWMTQSGLVQRIPPIGSSDRDRGLRAAQAICRDIMKRWRDGQIAHGNGRVERMTPNQHESGQQDGQGVLGAPAMAFNEYDVQESRASAIEERQEFAVPQSHAAQNHNSDFQIDPTLLMATGEMPIAMHNSYVDCGPAPTFDGSLREASSGSSSVLVSSSHPSMYFS